MTNNIAEFAMQTMKCSLTLKIQFLQIKIGLLF